MTPNLNRKHGATCTTVSHDPILPALFLVAPEPGSVAPIRTLGLNLIAGLLFGYACNPSRPLRQTAFLC